MKLAVSTMTNCLSFLSRGTRAGLEELHSCGATAIEISQHIRFEKPDVDAVLEASDSMGLRVCAISCVFSPDPEAEVPSLQWEGQPILVRTLEKHREELVDLCRRFGCRYLRFGGFPGSRLQTPEQVKLYMAALELQAAALSAQGIGLCLHNHADEFMRVDGKWLLQWAMELAPHLLLELDVKNAYACGVDPCSLLRRYRGKVRLMHMQDIAVVATDDWLKPSYRGVAPGEGNIDWETICLAAAASGVEYAIIEQAEFYGQDVGRCIRSGIRTLQPYCLEPASLVKTE